eukprot:3254288-Rhodomonas_salina.3
MHATDRKTGETLEKEFDGKKSEAPTQPAHDKTSEDGGASGVRADPTERSTAVAETSTGTRGGNRHGSWYNFGGSNGPQYY